jgi:tRNA nucleotidyltransferase/poly(A) polymerase
VTFTDDIFEDLARRDLTINAIAWGRRDQASPIRLLDPADGLSDLKAGIVRAVGDPVARFDEDALRLLRAVRIAAQLGFTIEPHTLAAMSQHAADVAWLSEDRVGSEVRRMLATALPSRAFAVMLETRILEVVLPELLGLGAAPVGTADPPLACDRAATRGPEHAFLVLDAVVARSPGSARLALAALLHGVHPDDRIRGVTERWRVPGREGSAVLRLVAALHSSYGPLADDEDVRRWMRRSGRDLLHDLARLREAHDAVTGSEVDRAAGDDLRRRVQAQVEAGAPLDLADLAIDGDDVRRELGIPEGPLVGAILEGLLEASIEDPGRNDRDRLVVEARRLANELTAPHGVGSGE